jgi:hypothetical protein
MKSIGLQAIAMAVGASMASGVACADGTVSIPVVPSRVADQGGLNLRQVAGSPLSPFRYRVDAGAPPGGAALPGAAYRAPPDGFTGDANLPGTSLPGLTASRAGDEPPKVFDPGQDAPVTFGSILAAVLWSSPALVDPRRGAFMPMLKHRAHAVPYDGETDTRGFGWR